MANNDKIISTSKFLSLVLRHRPEVIGAKLDPEGWLCIDELIAQANAHGKALALELLHEVVATNDKKRFALSEDGLRIRASQGHSVSGVELNLEQKTPPEILYHGTVVDLTCEFTEPIAKWPGVSYLCFPMLDGLGASPEQLRTLAAEIIELPSPVLIHCAQGHGRTGLVAAAVVLASGKAQTAEEGIAMIQSVRPGVELNRMQRSLLEQIE